MSCGAAYEVIHNVGQDGRHLGFYSKFDSINKQRNWKL